MATRTPEEQSAHDRIAADLAAGKDPFGDDEPVTGETVEEAAARAQRELDARNNATPEEIAAREAAEAAEADRLAKEQAKADRAAAKAAKVAKAAEDAAAAAAAADAEAGASTDEDDDPDAPGDEGEDDDAAAAAAAAQLEQDEAHEEPQPYRGPPVSELDKKRSDLRTEKAGQFKKLMDGEIDAEAYSVEETRISDALDDLNAQRAVLKSKQEARLDYEMSALADVAAKAAKDDKIVYAVTKGMTPEAEAAATKAAKQFDTALTMLRQDPDNARRPFRSIAREAHAAVLALRGIVKAQATSDPNPKPAAGDKTPPARANGKGPATLRDIPAAATVEAGGGLAAVGAKLKGQAYEDWYGGLSAANKAKMRGDEDA